MSTPRIVVTATGALCVLGTTSASVRQGLAAWPAAGSLKSFPFHEFDRDTPCFRAYDFDPPAVLGKKGLRLKDRATKLLLGVLEQEFRELLATFDPEGIPGICVGTAFGSLQSIGDFLSDSIVNGVNNVNPQLFANTVINAPTGNANIRYGVRTLSATVATGFNAGLDAIIYAADQIRMGYYPAIVAGGLEELSYYSILGLARTGVLSHSGRMRPFAPDTDGYVPGEGCGLVLLESLEHARSRGASILAEVSGVANTFDFATGNQTDLRGEGARAAITQACSMAGIAPPQLSLVAASANATPGTDALEGALLRELAPDVPVAAYKAKTGECYGASPALNLVCSLLDAARGSVSPTANGFTPIAGINLEGGAQLGSGSHILVNAFSCEGNCSCIVLTVH